MKSVAFFYLISLFLHGIEAKNDWSKPCLSGSCSFDIPASKTSMAATLSINGSPTSISDITTAAGWSILNCSTSAESQTIQLACIDESKGCNHLFQEGAEGTIVRLPEDCGAGPFARVAKHIAPANQSLPSEVASKLRRTDGTTPQVQLLQIDANLTGAASSGKSVDFAVIASSEPGLSISSSNFNDSTSGETGLIPPEDNNFEMFNNNIGGKTLAVSTVVDMGFTFSYTFNITGSFDTSSVNTFDATFTIPFGSYEGSISFVAELTDTFSTGNIVLFSTAIPGLTIPSVLTVDPTFIINGDASGTVALPGNATVGMQYEFDSFSYTVGSSGDKVNPPGEAGFIFFDAPFQFSIQQEISAQTSITAHAIPTAEFVVSAFGESATISSSFSSGTTVSLSATGNDPSRQECATITLPYKFQVGATGDFFNIITSALDLSLVQLSIPIIENECQTEPTDP